MSLNLKKLWVTGAALLCTALPVALTQPSSAQSKEVTIELAAYLFADTYCQFRADGRSHRPSENNAQSETLAYLSGIVMSLRELSPEWHQLVLDTLAWKCPEQLPESQKKWRTIKP
jgi:hypothetical protein